MPKDRDRTFEDRTLRLVQKFHPTLSAQQPADEISITVAGMAQLPQASRIGFGLFMRTLAYLINRERSAKPSPLAVDEVTVTSEEVGLELIMGLQRLDPSLLKLDGLDLAA